MDTREERRQHFLHDQQTNKRLRLATTRLHEAERERIWAIVAASDAGLSIRQIATATGLSRSCIHQLLQDAEAREIPAWLTHLRDRDHTSEGQADTKPSSSQNRRASPCGRRGRSVTVKPRHNILYSCTPVRTEADLTLKWMMAGLSDHLGRLEENGWREW